MRLRELIVAGLVCVSMVLFAGCQSGSGSGGGSGEAAANDGMTGDDTEGGGVAGGDGAESADADEGGLAGEEATTEGDEADDTDAGDAEAETSEGDAEGSENAGDETELTEEEIEAINSFVFNVESLAGVLAALGAAQLPSTDELPIVVTNPFSECPKVTIDEGLLIVDYGNGCEPVLYPGSTFSGTITGEVNVAARTIILTFDDFTVDGDTANGTTEAAVSQDGNLLILEGTVDLTFTSETEGYGGTITGEMTVEINLVTGEVLIPWAEGMSTDLSGDTYGFTLNDVHSDPLGNVNFLPDAGTATLILGTEGPGALTIAITFTEDTPTDGTVLVSVNGSSPVVLSLEDVYYIEE